MLELDELDDLDVVAHRSEQLCTSSVRHLGREPLAQRAVSEQRPEGGVVELRQELVLAARDREDDAGAGADGAIERRVRGRVARMEADDEIDSREAVVAGDVADLEAQALCPEPARKRFAVRDDLGS